MMIYTICCVAFYLVVMLVIYFLMPIMISSGELDEPENTLLPLLWIIFLPCWTVYIIFKQLKKTRRSFYDGSFKEYIHKKWNKTKSKETHNKNCVACGSVKTDNNV